MEYRNIFKFLRWTILPVTISVTTFAADGDSQNSQQQERFFENRIRPLLVKHCFECHGAAKQQAELRLDSREAMLKGNETGPAVVPGKPEQSRLVQVIQYSDDDVQMPPKGKLQADEIALLTAWVKQGAFWPPQTSPTRKQTQEGIDFDESRRSHWAFRPVVAHSPPAVKNTSWPRTPIDNFILAELEAKGLKPAKPADRRTLIRRVTYDLLGLPPRLDEVEDFVKDPSPDAYEKLLDRLLASPHYGERWGRHWLDVARYADSKGYVFAEETRYPYAYTYRDYVIGAFNEDLPYDRFVLEQIAADRLESKETSSLAALGFLTVGRRFRNSEPDIIDDRIDVVTRGLMGLTAACARCHDHKYDPIPTEDYYSLYGIFDGCYEPEEPPLLAVPDQTDAYRKYKRELDKRQAEVDKHIDDNYRKLLDEIRSTVGDYLLLVVKSSARVSEDFALSFQSGEPRPQIVAAWKKFLNDISQEHLPVFAPWRDFAALPVKKFAQQAQALIVRYRKGDFPAESRTPINPLVLKAFAENPPGSMRDVATVYGKLLTEAYKQNKQKEPDAADLKQLLQVFYGNDTPTALSMERAQRLFNRVARNKLRELKKNVQQWKLNSPSAPPRAMVLLDDAQPVSPVVFLRGNPSRRGKRVPRRFPRILAGKDGPEFTSGSGRLELARSIVDPENPLTARVLVNRVWLHHFGNGLVNTPSDFGARSRPPTHPELLDTLTLRFIEGGWSIKKLQRMILLSATYRQSSDDHPENRKIDPENRLLWRMPRRRLGFEEMRDSILAASGRLEQKMKGRPVDLLKNPSPGRRTVYGFVDRNNLPSLFRIFDFANPDASTGKRSRTTVPQQALFAMNSPFVIAQSEWLASQAEVVSQPGDAEKVREIYRRVFAREPDPGELSLAVRYLQGQEKRDSGKQAQREKAGSGMTPPARLAQILLLTNEFLFVD